MIEDQLAPSRAIVKLERGGLSVAEIFASSDVNYEYEVPLRAEYLRQGRFSDAEAYDLSLNAKPAGLEALRAILVPPEFDAAATQRYMEFAFARLNAAASRRQAGSQRAPAGFCATRIRRRKMAGYGGLGSPAISSF
jgi:hypothetical protein